MHILQMNTKGGTGKSTLTEYMGAELSRLGHVVSISNTDQQEHVTVASVDNSDFYLYDTAGAFTEDNVRLLNAIGSNPDLAARIIVPISTGKNDRKEVPFLIESFNEYGVLDRVVFVINKARQHSAAVTATKEYIKSLGLTVARSVIPQIEDFAQGRHTTRTRNEISALIHEVIL